ncbi:MAG: LPS export ABC transporter permease LptF [Pseudomonadota bacterium]
MNAVVGGIFFRHVLREIAVAFVVVALVLLVLLVTNQLAFVLNRAADGQIPSSVVVELLWLSVSENSVTILPIALLLGVIVALGRLYHDSEMAAAQACGVGPGTLYASAGVVSVATAALCAWIAFSAGPDAARRTYEIRGEAMRTAATRGLAPGQFRSLGGGTVLYFRARDEDGTLRDVFFQRRIRTPDQTDTGRIEVVLAASARYSLSADGNLYTVVLQDGQRHEGIPGQGAWSTMHFRQQTVPVRTPEAGLGGLDRVDVKSASELLASPEPRARAEFHWRIATVIISLVVGLLAVPIAKLRPRRGRYTRVVWGILLYAIYANLLIAGRTLIEQDSVPPWLGLWWVHGLVALLGLAIIKLPALGDWLSRRRA